MEKLFELILAELRIQKANTDKINERVTAIQMELTALRSSTKVWLAIIASVPSIIVTILAIMNYFK